jgi:hypothetical protein
LKIALYTEPLPPSFHWSPEKAWRGTEEFYVETAKALFDLGHSVEVFYDGPSMLVEQVAFGGGVVYRPRVEYRGGFDAVLCCNAQPPGLFPGTRHVYWSNLHGDRFERHLWADAQIVISAFQRQNHETPPDTDQRGGPGQFRTAVVGHGVDAGKYVGGVKEPLALYSSSMDRGGHWLKANWGSFGTGLTLVCTEGRLSNAEVDDLYRRARVWLHPAMGVELFCISALKAQAAGCLCVYSPTMALPETVRPGHLPLAPHRWRRDLAGRLVTRAAPPVPELPSWMDVTKQIEAVLLNTTRQRGSKKPQGA